MWKEKKPLELKENPFEMIGKDWLLITAGTKESCNAMTASWGGLGVLWGKNVVTVYIRPQRYTKEFVDAQDTFTLSFFDGKYFKKASLNDLSKYVLFVYHTNDISKY